MTAPTYSATDTTPPGMLAQTQAQAAPGPEPLDPRLCDRTPAEIEMQKRQEAAWDAYFGKFNDSVEKQANKRDRNVKANRCAAIVDKTAAWLSKGLTIEVADKGAPVGKPKPKPARKPPMMLRALPTNAGADGEPDADDETPPPPDPRQEMLDRILGDQDRFKAFLTMVFMSGSVTGHAYVKISYDETKRGPANLPKFTVLDSQHVHVLTHPDDCNMALAYVIEYATQLRLLHQTGQSQSLIKRQIIARVSAQGYPRYGAMDTRGQMPDGAGEIADDDEWTIATYTRLAPSGQDGKTYAALGMGGGAWTLQGEVSRWPYPFPPIADCMNLPAPTQYYGLPDLPPEIIHLNQRVNDVQTDTATVLEAFAMPMPWMSGLDANMGTIRPEPGTVLPLPDGAQAGVLQPRGDIASNRDFANDLRADMDERSRVPAVALGRQESLPKGNLSGVALELLFQPLIEKIILQRVLYGPMISCLCLWALVLVGAATLDDTEIRLDWADLLPRDDAATAQMILAMSQVGTSQHAINTVLGLDDAEEQEYKREESQGDAAAMVTGMALPQPGAIPPVPPAPPAENDGGNAPADAAPPQQPPAQPATGNGGTMPPTNHPAAIAQRARVAATKKGS